jgi:hypothetical protein
MPNWLVVIIAYFVGFISVWVVTQIILTSSGGVWQGTVAYILSMASMLFCAVGGFGLVYTLLSKTRLSAPFYVKAAVFTAAIYTLVLGAIYQGYATPAEAMLLALVFHVGVTLFAMRRPA